MYITLNIINNKMYIKVCLNVYFVVLLHRKVK